MTRASKPIWFPLVAAVVLLNGCDIIGTACDAEVRPGILIELEDEENGTPVTVEDATAIASRDGNVTSFIDGGRLPEMNEMIAFVDDVGSYSVEVTKPGFKTWVDGDVGVEGTQCGLETTRVVVRLERP